MASKGKKPYSPKGKKKPSADEVKLLADRAAARAKGEKPKPLPGPKVAAEPEEEIYDPKAATEAYRAASATRVDREKKWDPSYVDQVKRLCRLGLTDNEIALYFEIKIQTFWMWRAKHPDFVAALRTGREFAHERVERAAYQCAVGYTIQEIKLFHHQGMVVEHPVDVYYPPDGKLAMRWLESARAKKWANPNKVELSGPGGKPVEIENMDSKELAKRIAFTLLAGLPQKPVIEATATEVEPAK